MELGLQGCQLDPSHLQGWNETLVTEVGEFCLKHGLFLELGSAGADFERLSRRLVLGARVGARAIRTLLAGERNSMSDAQRAEFARDAIEKLKRLAEVAEGVGVPLAIENHRDFTSTELAEIVNEVGSPFVGVCLDNANALPVWEDAVECAKTLAPLAVAFHLKDWRQWWDEGVSVTEGCALGQGHARVAEVYQLMHEANPDIPANLQVVTAGPRWAVRTLDEEDANVIESIDFVRSL
jgi:sugar phosphate isomerase/epimerase